MWPASWDARSAEIEGILGYRSGDALVHRDDLVILRKDWQVQRRAGGLMSTPR